MARVFLYEDSGGGLYLHRQHDDTVYANIEVMIPYGANFEQDASEIAGGGPVTGDGVLKIPYAEIEPRILDAQMHRIAVWHDGKVQRLAPSGRDGVQYLQPQSELNPAFDISDQTGTVLD